MLKEVKEQTNGQEYMLEPVPMEARRPTFNQIMVWVGFGYVVTGLFVGGVLAGSDGSEGLNPWGALWAIAIGMGLLFVMTVALGIIAQRTGMNLALVSRYSYGVKGSNVPMVVMSLLTLGWFASITGMTGDIWGAFLGNPSGIILFEPSQLGYTGIPPVTLEVFLCCLVSGLLFTFCAYRGIKAIEAAAIPVSPLILILALVVGIGLLNEGGGFSAFWEKASQIDGLSIGSGITVVVGSWIAGAVMGVDLFRFNKNIKAVFLCAAACFIFTNPLLNIIGYIGAVQVGRFNYIEWMITQGMVLAIIGVIAWTMSLWTTNNAELYCNALYTGPILESNGEKANRKKIVLIVGLIGTFLGSMAFYQMFFNDFITILGAAAPPLAGPIIADYFIVKKQNYEVAALNQQPSIRWAGVLTFLIGAVLGVIFQYGMTLPFDLPSGVVALVITIIIYPIIYKMTNK